MKPTTFRGPPIKPGHVGWILELNRKTNHTHSHVLFAHMHLKPIVLKIEYHAKCVAIAYVRILM